MTFIYEEYETWQVTALRKLCQLQLQIVEGEIADLTCVTNELRAIAEMLSGLPDRNGLLWADI